MVDKYMGFDAFEMHPVREGVGKDGSRYYDQCEEDDPNLKYWSVYGHLPDGGIECITDCPIKEDALLIHAALEKILHKGWIAVIGRIPFDDEDSCYVYNGLTLEQAHKEFEVDIYNDSGKGEGDREYNLKDVGHAVYINHTICSASEMEIT